jgi:hypothetical protein
MDCEVRVGSEGPAAQLPPLALPNRGRSGLRDHTRKPGGGEVVLSTKDNLQCAIKIYMHSLCSCDCPYPPINHTVSTFSLSVSFSMVTCSLQLFIKLKSHTRQIQRLFVSILEWDDYNDSTFDNLDCVLRRRAFCRASALRFRAGDLGQLKATTKGGLHYEKASSLSESRRMSDCTPFSASFGTFSNTSPIAAVQCRGYFAVQVIQ